MAVGIFKKAAKKTAKKPKKNATPEFKIEEPGENDQSPKAKTQRAQRNAMLNFTKAKKEEKDAKAKLKKAEAGFLDRVVEEHLKTCQRDSKYYSSIKAVVDDDDHKESKLTIKFANKYSKIASENEDELRSVYGDKYYDRFFEEKTEAKLTNKALNDEEFVKTITEAIGEEKFAEYFDVEQFILPKKTYHEARMIDQELAMKHEEAVDADLVRSNKPSVVPG